MGSYQIDDEGFSVVQLYKNGQITCDHEKRKSQCAKCGGCEVCPCGTRKAHCVKHKGKEVCPCGKRRAHCVKHNGKEICPCGKIKPSCYKHDNPKNWCSVCKCTNIRNSKYKPYCFYCYSMLNPDKIPPRKYKLKEHYLTDALKEKYTDVEFVFDKKVDGGCSSRRPDVRIECYTHTIIVECDENRHRNYLCESKRIMEIYKDLGLRPVIYLRFNPDAYTEKSTGEKISSCFKATASINNCVQKKEWNRRLKILTGRIDHYLKNPPKKEVTEEKLFY